jgi:hypothetical protein
MYTFDSAVATSQAHCGVHLSHTVCKYNDACDIVLTFTCFPVVVSVDIHMPSCRSGVSEHGHSLRSLEHGWVEKFNCPLAGTLPSGGAVSVPSGASIADADLIAMHVDRVLFIHLPWHISFHGTINSLGWYGPVDIDCWWFGLMLGVWCLGLSYAIYRTLAAQLPMAGLDLDDCHCRTCTPKGDCDRFSHTVISGGQASAKVHMKLGVGLGVGSVEI